MVDQGFAARAGLCDRLNHRPKDVWVDGLPIKFAALKEEPARGSIESWNRERFLEKAPVDVRESLVDGQPL